MLRLNGLDHSSTRKSVAYGLRYDVPIASSELANKAMLMGAPDYQRQFALIDGVLYKNPYYMTAYDRAGLGAGEYTISNTVTGDTELGVGTVDSIK